jgi:hypothetical protein
MKLTRSEVRWLTVGCLFAAWVSTCAAVVTAGGRPWELFYASVTGYLPAYFLIGLIPLYLVLVFTTSRRR